jgi:POT family proton-dependent oligopeptide transporter
VGELLISGLGTAMVSRYIAPQRRGLMIGTWFLAAGIAQYIGSLVANYATVPASVTAPAQTLALYAHLFIVLGWVGAGGTLLALLMLPLMHRLEAGHSAGERGSEPQNPADTAGF